jgi:hypothetical protein
MELWSAGIESKSAGGFADAATLNVWDGMSHLRHSSSLAHVTGFMNLLCAIVFVARPCCLTAAQGQEGVRTENSVRFENLIGARVLSDQDTDWRTLPT